MMRSTRISTVLALVLAGLAPAASRAERLILTNGLEVRGYVVGHESGSYLVRIGGYTKKVPAAQVKSIVEDDAQPSAPAPSVTPPAGPTPGAPPAATLDIGSLLGGGGGGDLQGLLGQLGGKSGGGAAGGLDLQGLLGGLGGGAAPGGGMADIQQLFGGGGGGGGMNLMSIAEKMRDPAFQQSFLAQLEAKNKSGPNPGAATPYIGMLKGLFQQLNAKQGLK